MEHVAQHADTVAATKAEPMPSREIQPPPPHDHKHHAVLLVTAAQMAQTCAEDIAAALDCTVELAESRKSAIALLRRQEFSAVVVDDALAEADLAGADQLFSAAGMAVPMQVNFAISSSARVIRELRAALYRRQADEARARTAVESNLQAELGSALTGMVLELDLLRSGQDFPPAFRNRLVQLTNLTTELRRKLVPAMSQKDAMQASIGAVKSALRTSAAKDAAERAIRR
jgi:hypothetical protein